jgi:hypothetical protein
MSLRPILRAATLAGLLILPAPDRLAACAFHTALPEATVSQQIGGATLVIAARPAEDDPFRFEPVAILTGEGSASRPPHLVDSTTRARLARNPGEAVLFAREADGSWTRLLLLDAATRPLVDRMIARAGAWTEPEGAAERRDVFAALLAHPDNRIRALALRELDALPYGVLRGGTYPVGAADLLEGLADINELPFASIRILLLGLDDGEIAREAIARRLAVMASQRVALNLGPWITAAIESGGEEGLASVERALTPPTSRLTDAQLTEIVRAFSVVSAEGDPGLRLALDGTIRRLVSVHPTAAPLVAQAFGATADYSQADLIRDLVAAGAFRDIAGQMAAVAYIISARTSEGGIPGRTGVVRVSTSK